MCLVVQRKAGQGGTDVFCTANLISFDIKTCRPAWANAWRDVQTSTASKCPNSSQTCKHKQNNNTSIQ